MVYETMAFIIFLDEDEFQSIIKEMAPGLIVDFDLVPRSMVNANRRDFSEIDLRMENITTVYVDDILKIVVGNCEYRGRLGPVAVMRSSQITLIIRMDSQVTIAS